MPAIAASYGASETAVQATITAYFIAFGLGETAKVALIVIGIAPFMIRDIAAHTAALPREQIIKAQTLGASTWQLALRVVLPQAMPRLIQAVRLSLGPAWVFLISAEAIAADIGLGYRIFLVRRYLAMDVILPYVAWIAILAAIGILGAFLAWALRSSARPRKAALLKRHREAYQNHRCPVCDFPIFRGAFRQAVWTKRGPWLPGGAPGQAESSRYTCPSCGEALFDQCGDCGEVTQTLLPYCSACGRES